MPLDYIFRDRNAFGAEGLLLFRLSLQKVIEDLVAERFREELFYLLSKCTPQP